MAEFGGKVVNRRSLLVCLPLGLPIWSIVRAQQARRTIAYLSPYTSIQTESFRDAFLEGMKTLGYARDKDFVLVQRFAEGRNERLQELADELVRLKPDLIFVATTNLAVAAQQASTSIPIVFYSVADPVRAGLADSLSHPGRNLTGLTNLSADLNGKRFQLLKQLVPSLKQLAILANPTNPYYSTQLERMRPAAELLGLRLLLVSAATADELEPAFRSMTQQHADAVLITPDVYLTAQAGRISELALRSRLPSMFATASAVQEGALISYGVDDLDAARYVTKYVDKILKGAKPGDLPIEQPTKIDLAINRKTSAALGLDIPRALLLQAQRVIE